MRLKQIAVFVSLLTAHAGLAASSPEVTGSAYRADVPFPQFLHLWSEGWALKDRNGEPVQYATTNMPLGGYVHLYIRNVSAKTIPVTDVKLEGVSLVEAIAFSDQGSSISTTKRPKMARRVAIS